MKRKIINHLSYGLLIASAVTSPFISLEEITLVPASIWGACVIVSTIGIFYGMSGRKENAPDERQLNQGNSKKFYNFILNDKGVKVNEN